MHIIGATRGENFTIELKSNDRRKYLHTNNIYKIVDTVICRQNVVQCMQLQDKLFILQFSWKNKALGKVLSPFIIYVCSTLYGVGLLQTRIAENEKNNKQNCHKNLIYIKFSPVLKKKFFNNKT